MIEARALRAALAAGAARLGGGPAAWADARALLAHALGIDRAALALMPDGALTPAQAAAFDAALARRAGGAPVAKIVGYRDFWKHRFRVTADVLDPRPDTETLIEAALAEPFDRVLDLGTGSGCIVISLLAERTEARGMAVDLSEPALRVAAENARTLGVDARLDLRLGSWFGPVTGAFDLIVSNPPYIAQDEMPGLAPEVRDHDPAMALTDGGDGLGAYRALAAGVGAHLAPGGRVIVEIGPTQGAAVAALMRDAGLAGVAVAPDIDGRDRIVTARRPA